MVKKFNPFPAPKKGTSRLILKRPSTSKTTSCNQVPYQRHSEGTGVVRVDQTKWRRTIQELIKATDAEIAMILKNYHFLPELSGKVCPKCETGVLSPLKEHTGRNGLWHRCSRKHCQQYVSPIHLHYTPSSPELRGPKGIHCKCNQQPCSCVSRRFL